MSNLNQKGNEGRKQRADVRRKEMLTLAAKGKTNKQISEVLGVKEKTVENSLAIARKEPLVVTDENRQATLDELSMLRDEVLSHRKGDKPLPLAAIDRLIKITEVVMRLEGTAAPTRSVATNVNVDAQNVGPYRKFVLACSGLEESQIEQLLVMAREMPRISRPRPEPPDSSPLWAKQLKEANDETA
jgi:Bacterial regulatory proteins, luxR family